MELNRTYRNPASYVYLPPWPRRPLVQLVVTLINVPVYWSSLAALIYGFFILRWYVVLICLAATFIIVPLFHVVVLPRVLRGFFNPWTEMVISWLVLLVVPVWYFWFR